jgi:hypothetical protein
MKALWLIAPETLCISLTAKTVLVRIARQINSINRILLGIPSRRHHLYQHRL